MARAAVASRTLVLAPEEFGSIVCKYGRQQSMHIRKSREDAVDQSREVNGGSLIRLRNAVVVLLSSKSRTAR